MQALFSDGGWTYLVRKPVVAILVMQIQMQLMVTCQPSAGCATKA